MIHIAGRPFGIGALLALVGLIIVVVLFVAHVLITPDDVLGLFVLAFLALLIP